MRCPPRGANRAVAVDANDDGHPRALMKSRAGESGYVRTFPARRVGAFRPTLWGETTSIQCHLAPNGSFSRGLGWRGQFEAKLFR
jgi:hypothetical protein